MIFTGSENVGHKMLPKELQEHFVFIHADPGKIDSSIISTISFDDILNDLEKLRKTPGVEKIAILGHSMFGRIPLECAVKYPDNISYAISTGSVPYSTEAWCVFCNRVAAIWIGGQAGLSNSRWKDFSRGESVVC